MSRVDIVVLGAILLAASVTDIRDRRIPNMLMAIAAALFVPIHFGEIGLIAHRLTAGVLCSVCALAISVTYDVFRDTPGLGMGDIKLLFVIGLYSGVGGLWIFFVGTLAGAAFGIIAICLGYATRESRLPFAPFLFVGWIVVGAGLIPGPILSGP